MGTQSSKATGSGTRPKCIECGAPLAKRKRRSFTGYCQACYRARPFAAKAGPARALTAHRRHQLIGVVRAVGDEGRIPISATELLELLDATLPRDGVNTDVDAAP